MEPVFKNMTSDNESETEGDSELADESQNFDTAENKHDDSHHKERVENSREIKGDENSATCPNSNLTDGDYDDIFSSVLERASSGKLEAKPPKNSWRKAQESFQKHFKSVKSNEFTPSTSPQHDAEGKLLNPKVKKPKSKRKRSGEGKEKKSLTYSTDQTLKSKPVCKHGKAKPKLKRPRTEEVVIEAKINQGVWVQCSKLTCLKWRFLESSFDPSQVPEHWICSMNIDDPEFNSCDAPEVDWSSEIPDEEGNFIYTDYNVGSIVWARTSGYPYWPAMVDFDPDEEVFYDHTPSGKVIRYHVTFLDKHVSRSWIHSKFIEPFHKDPYKMDKKNKSSFGDDLSEAISEARKAQNMSVEERIQKYNFATRYSFDKKSSNKWANHVKKDKSKKKGMKKIVDVVKRNKVESSQVVPSSSPAEDDAVIDSSPANEEFDEEAKIDDDSDFDMEKAEKETRKEVDEFVNEVEKNSSEKKTEESSSRDKTAKKKKTKLDVVGKNKNSDKSSASSSRPKTASKKKKKEETTSGEPSVKKIKKSFKPSFAPQLSSSSSQSIAKTDEIRSKKLQPVSEAPKTHLTDEKEKQRTKSENTDSETDRAKTKKVKKVKKGFQPPSSSQASSKFKPAFKAAFKPPSASQKKADEAVVPPSSQDSAEMTLTTLNSVKQDSLEQDKGEDDSEIPEFSFECQLPPMIDHSAHNDLGLNYEDVNVNKFDSVMPDISDF